MIKDAVKIPVIGVNTVKTPEFAETLIEDGVTLTKCEDGSSVFVEADHVVLALGTKSRKDLITAFEKEIDRVIPLGETLKTPGRVAVSLQDGYIAARGFDPEA